VGLSRHIYFETAVAFLTSSPSSSRAPDIGNVYDLGARAGRAWRGSTSETFPTEAVPTGSPPPRKLGSILAAEDKNFSPRPV